MRSTLAIALATLSLNACRPSPPPGSKLAWDEECVDDEACSTHLFVVQQGLRIAAQHQELAGAQRIVAKLSAPDCQAAWRQGLFDADFKAVYNDGKKDLQPYPGVVEMLLAGATWRSHFFDPDSGENYKGETTPTAFTQALLYGGSGDCYELGLALHYFTDITQPMHTANFTMYGHPLELHGHFETYAMSVQGRYAVADWRAETALDGDEAALIMRTAQASKALWPAQYDAIKAAYESRCLYHVIDAPSCWTGDAGVDAVLGESLAAAQEATARYLIKLGERL
jgi:phospholipase C